MNRDDAIKKIRKCLSLSKSGNEAEAATALRQAQALMREHGLDAEGVELASVTENDVRARFIPVLHWEAALAGMVAEAFGCEVVSTHKFDRGGVQGILQARHVRYWRLIGVNAAPEIAGYVLDVLAGQCVRARLAHMAKQSRNCKPITKTARGDAFASGWVQGVQALVERFAASERNTALIEAYMSKNYPNLASAKVKRRDLGRNVKDDAWLGREAARNATLNNGVGGPLERRLIEGSR